MKDNPLLNYKNHHNDEELVKLANDLYNYSVKELLDLRKTYPTIPKDLKVTESFYKDLIRISSNFLVETHNWYDKNV